MEARAHWLLTLPDPVLFAHGGCHLFALALKEFTGFPLLWVQEQGGRHDHLGCSAPDGRLVDCFGWFSEPEYIRAERLDDHDITFVEVDEDAVRRRFITGAGNGYYVHPDFLGPATKRALAWIARYREYFDGTTKTPIPGLSRLNRTGSRALW